VLDQPRSGHFDGLGSGESGCIRFTDLAKWPLCRSMVGFNDLVEEFESIGELVFIERWAWYFQCISV